VKRYSATEARARWFAILDEVVQGESVVIDRKGRQVVLRCEELKAQAIPDYSKVIRCLDGDEADQWSWRWDAESGVALNS
jgi:hypothetical protein